MQKTLKYLEEQTGIEWGYNYGTGELYNSIEQCSHNLIYFIKTGETFINEQNEISITTVDFDKMIRLTPLEFIEKIEKGEWE